MKKQSNMGWRIALIIEAVFAIYFAIRIAQGFIG